MTYLHPNGEAEEKEFSEATEKMFDSAPAKDSTDSSAVLTQADLLKAVKAIKEASKQPFIVSLSSSEDIESFFEKSAEARNFIYGGIPLHKDSSLPEGIARFTMSDGTFKDVPISNKVKYITHNSYFKSLEELEDTKKLILEGFVKKGLGNEWSIVILNIIKFPVK